MDTDNETSLGANIEHPQRLLLDFVAIKVIPRLFVIAAGNDDTVFGNPNKGNAIRWTHSCWRKTVLFASNCVWSCEIYHRFFIIINDQFRSIFGRVSLG